MTGGRVLAELACAIALSLTRTAAPIELFTRRAPNI